MARIYKRASLEERFWNKVSVLGKDECWPWTGSVMGTGYGNIKVSLEAGNVYAHRLSYEIANGPIPEGLMVDHSCLNRICVNPAHLRLATVKQNNENMPGARRHSISGIRGVHYDARCNRWYAYVIHNRERLNLGGFDCAEDAEAAAIQKRNELFTHNTLDRKSA